MNAVNICVWKCYKFITGYVNIFQATKLNSLKLYQCSIEHIAIVHSNLLHIALLLLIEQSLLYFSRTSLTQHLWNSEGHLFFMHKKDFTLNWHLYWSNTTFPSRWVLNCSFTVREHSALVLHKHISTCTHLKLKIVIWLVQLFCGHARTSCRVTVANHIILWHHHYRSNLIENLLWQYKQTGYIWEQYDDSYGGGKVSTMPTMCLTWSHLPVGDTPLYWMVITHCIDYGWSVLNC